MKLTKKKKIWLTALLALLILLAIAFDSRLIIRHYVIEAAEIKQPLRLALITDLHSCRYGEAEQKLTAAIQREQPDILVLAGDIFDDQIPNDNTEALLQSVASNYPCYYVTGNHEYWQGAEAFTAKMEILAKYNVQRLAGDCAAININGQNLLICGVDDPDLYRIADNAHQADGLTEFNRQLQEVQKAAQGSNYTVLLAHRPEYFQQYADLGFDLILSGHAHGGQWRLPGLINGVYAPGQGLFPKYAGGVYTQGSCTMAVSRGLARESTRIPRIFNRPELVIIDLKKNRLAILQRIG